MTEWLVHSFQPGPRDTTNPYPRFDMLILAAAIAELGQYGKVVGVEEITPPPHPWHNWGSYVFRGVQYEGMIGDAVIFEEVKEGGRFWVVDYQDADAGPAFQLAKAPGFAGAYITMFHPPSIAASRAQWVPNGGGLTPGWFTDIDPRLTEDYVTQVEEVRAQGNLDPRLYFSGTIHGETPETQYMCGGYNIREAAVVLREKYPDEVRVDAEKMERPQWFLEAARHAVNLVLPGDPWCYREFELFHLGIPVLTYEWEHELHHRWVPDVHYASVRGVGARHKMGFPYDAELAADLIIARHRAVLRRPALFGAWARAAQKHYQRYFTPERIGAEMVSNIVMAAKEGS